MSGGLPEPSISARRLPASDPGLVADAAPWWSGALSGTSFPLEAQGPLGPLPWTEVERRGATALARMGLDPGIPARPRLVAANLHNWVEPLGYGCLLGEAGLKVEKKGPFKPTYSSFVAMIRVWVAPPLPKDTADQTGLPHLWAVWVGAGRVFSGDTVGKSGRFRAFRSIDQLEPGFEWVPAAVLEALQSGGG